ncbi:MAG: VOC family protein [Treponema sp.]|jgi:lactoylglutathione lyase|nr:VOC family protein [Treponema sp.]
MFFRLEHNCIYVTDMGQTLAFYEKALNLRELRRKDSPAMEIVFIGNEESSQQVEIIRETGRTRPYDHGDNSVHFALRTDDIEAARSKHREMGCIDHEVPEFGVYYIKDPDGYLVEIMPVRK